MAPRTTATTWTAQEIEKYKTMEGETGGIASKSEYNNEPGTGLTGYHEIPPNNYPFYSEEEKYKPLIQSDGGILSDWKPLYNPTPEEAELDKKAAYESGVPHGYVPEGNKYENDTMITLNVISQLHSPDDYGSKVDKNGKHSGGAFKVQVSPKMRIVEVRKEIYKHGGIAPGLQRLAFAGKNLEDSQRTVEQYGIKYWNDKFPDWPLTIRRF